MPYRNSSASTKSLGLASRHTVSLAINRDAGTGLWLRHVCILRRRSDSATCGVPTNDDQTHEMGGPARLPSCSLSGYLSVRHAVDDRSGLCTGRFSIFMGSLSEKYFQSERMESKGTKLAYVSLAIWCVHSACPMRNSISTYRCDVEQSRVVKMPKLSSRAA